MTAVRGLVAACHPLPTAFVTAFVTGYGAVVGLTGVRLVLLALAVLVGQLSIGWCNDAVDAGLDVAADRRDKPVVAGLVTRRTVAVAAGLAALACVVASFALGRAAGTVHVVAVAAGWAYDLGLKRTPLSGLPYLVAFGLLPAVATQAFRASPAVKALLAPGVHVVDPGDVPYVSVLRLEPGSVLGPGWPPLALMAGTALLGLAAHFANTVKDVEADAATGVRGLPQRIGPQRSLVATAVLVAVAAAVLAVGAPGRTTSAGGASGRTTLALAVLVAGALAAAGGAVLAARESRRGLAFRATLVAVALVLAGVLVST